MVCKKLKNSILYLKLSLKIINNKNNSMRNNSIIKYSPTHCQAISKFFNASILL